MTSRETVKARIFSGADAWKLWLILAIAGLAAIISFVAANQGRTIEGAWRDGETLRLHHDHATLPVTALRRPDQSRTMALEPADFVSQADGFETWAAYDRYLKRKKDMHDILAGPYVMATVAPADRPAFEVRAKTRQMSITAYGYSFWVSLVVGLTSFLVGASVWCLKPGERVTRTLAVNGFGMLLAAVSSSAAFAQPVALSPFMITLGLAVNHLATVIFGLTMVGLFLRFPMRLVSERHYRWIMAAGIPVFALDQFRLLGSPSGIVVFCLAVLAAVVILIGIQFHMSRQSASARAALLWLGLAVIAGGGSWGAIVVIYLMRGQFHAMPESFVFLSFLILYGGVAVGVARFRLFEVSDWAFRIFFFTVAAVLFLALDAGLVYLVGLTRASSLTLALLAVAFGYLPLRDLLWRRFMRTPSLNESEMLGSVLDMAFVAEASQRQARWQALLRTLFTPLDLTATTDQGPEPHIEDDGLHLYVPGLVDTTALRLSYPRHGRGLFSPRHVALVAQIMRLSRKAAAGLSAYERGAAEQRERLAQDLHDTISGKLVSGLSVADDATRPFIHSALDDIRDIASALNSESVPLDRVIADMRHEAVRRLEVAGIALDWPVWPDDAPFVVLTATQKKALTASVRELITNIIKHARARSVTVSFTASADTLNGRIGDDGAGFPEAVISGIWKGHGLKNVSDRMVRLGGSMRFSNTDTGAIVGFDLPLRGSQS